MNILQIGPWVLLVIGAATLILAVVNSVNHGISKGRWLLWIFGFALCGVGIYGPEFFSSYTTFIQTISGLYTAATQKSVDDALMKIGRGDLTPQYSDITAQYILSHAPEGIDSMLDCSIAAALSRDGKEILINAKSVLRGMRTSATLVRKSLQSSENASALIDSLDPAMQAMVADEIMRLPDSLRLSIGIDRNKLTMLKSHKRPLLKGGI
jgi:hypothetical protein